MSLARFFSRIHDAVTPLLAPGTDLETVLGRESVALSAPDQIEESPIHVAGFVLAANLCARLYPRIHLIAPPRLRDDCAHLIQRVNPVCELETSLAGARHELAWARRPLKPEGISVSPAGWSVMLSGSSAVGVGGTNILTSLAAAALGTAELFRDVFGEWLPDQKRARSTGSFNVLTNAEPNPRLPDLPAHLSLGRIHLVGAGAVGQAAIYALARTPAFGTLVVVDPEEITLSNLQRYVLTHDQDVGATKVSLAERDLSRSHLSIEGRVAAWGEAGLEPTSLEVVCAAVDSAETRIAIQASLPARVYNAWTQPADLGWSRHERFGELPCLACLYWPTGARPHRHELIASALRQNPLRVLSYLTHNVPVDVPLVAGAIVNVAGMPRPTNSPEWTQRSLLQDVIEAMQLAAGTESVWAGKLLDDLYREGVCGGALLRPADAPVSAEVAVPLAHQSVLAGIMLAVQVIAAATPELRPWRPIATEGRLDLLGPIPPIVARPREPTPSCLCSDVDFRSIYDRKWAGLV